MPYIFTQFEIDMQRDKLVSTWNVIIISDSTAHFTVVFIDFEFGLWNNNLSHGKSGMTEWDLFSFQLSTSADNINIMAEVCLLETD